MAYRSGDGDLSLQSKATSRLRRYKEFTVHYALWGGFLPTLTLNHSLRRRYLGRLSYSIIDFRGIRRLRCNSFSALHRPKGFYPITHSLGDTSGAFCLRWSEPKSWATAPLCRLCGDLLSKSNGIMSLTEHWLMHSTSDVVGTAKMFALSSAVPLHLIFKVLPLSPL